MRKHFSGRHLRAGVRFLTIKFVSILTALILFAGCGSGSNSAPPVQTQPASPSPADVVTTPAETLSSSETIPVEL